MLDRTLDDNSTRWWAGYTLVTAALAYSNALALTLLLPHALLAIGHPRSRRRRLAAMATLAILLAPLAVLLTVERGRRNPLYWLNPPGWPNLDNVATSCS